MSGRLHTAALDLFVERGYFGTSVSDICRRAGMGRSSFYESMRSKEQLFLHLSAYSFEIWRATWRPLVDHEGSSIVDRLEQHLNSAVASAIAQPSAIALCRLPVARMPNLLAEKMSERMSIHRRDYWRLIAQLFELAKADDEVVRQPTETLAASWISFLDGILLQQLSAPTTEKALHVSHVHDCFRLYRRGIARRSAGPSSTQDLGQPSFSVETHYPQPVAERSSITC